MSVQHNISRRQFIKSVSGAGLVLGVHIRWGGVALATGQEQSSPFAPNAWLHIDHDGSVTITLAKSEMGQGVKTALPMIVADELDADWSRVTVVQAIADKKYGGMTTGGSASVRTSWDKLRQAGATARAMLVAAAAQRWEVPSTDCRTESGFVIHTPTGRRLSYGELADLAATLPVPESVSLKTPDAFTIIGKRIPRVDIPEKVDGSAVFGIDVRVPGMLFASVVRCPVFGGSVRSFDPARARALPGVVNVLGISSGIAIVARSTWEAFQGRDAVGITWDFGPNAHLSSAGIRSLLVEASARGGAVAESTGDVARAMGVAVKRVDAVYEVPFLAHATMEPQNCVADVRKDRCEIWAPTQAPQTFQRRAAEITGLPESSVTVHTTLLGGGFGRRFETDTMADAVEISKIIGAPIQVIWTREDDMTHDFYRPTSYHLLSGGLDSDGNLIAFRHTVVAPSLREQNKGGSVKNGLDKEAVEGAVDLPYAIPNFLVEYVMVQTPVPIGPWRSVYASQNVFAVESFMDELAHAAGKDPFTFRHDLVTRMPRMRKAMEDAAARAGWGNPLPPGHARGIALSPPAFFRTPVAQIVEISLNEKGTLKIERVVDAIDCGIVVNPDTVEGQMEGGFVFAATAALKGAITIVEGRVEQQNFGDYPLLTLDETPAVETIMEPSTEPPSGAGEPGVPPVAPALANAIFAATGKRLRTLPLTLSLPPPGRLR
jgi:isoquinoline 1-oxidoreductase subunit beta